MKCQKLFILHAQCSSYYLFDDGRIAFQIASYQLTFQQFISDIPAIDK